MKILVLRFSSIGDIVLTTPVVRALKQALPEAEIHFFTKASFRQIVESNPYIHKVHLLSDELGKQLKELKKEGFDHIIDLHNNLRTQRVKWVLGVPASTFDKRNWDKYRMTRFKTKIVVSHIVERYGETLKPLGVLLDQQGLDFFLPEGREAFARTEISQQSFPSQQAIAVVLGATYRTKRWLTEHFIELINAQGQAVMLLGGKDSLEEAETIQSAVTVPVFQAVGNYDLLTAAALMKQCQAVIAHDTGFMHIAAAFGMKIYSLWGNTIPEFGMTPYRTPHAILEVTDLSCRPCSKIGFQQCPKGHFNCMSQLTPAHVLKAMQS